MSLRSSPAFLAELAQLPKILQWVREQIEEVDLAAGDKTKLELAIEEAVVNIMTHGASKPSHHITRRTN